MLYSDVLLEACKSVSLVDDDAASLSFREKKLYAGYLRNAIARFNNNVNVSIGTEKVVVGKWHLDDLSYFARLVRGGENDLELFDEGTGANVSKIKWNGIDGRSMQELPQRLISATANSGVPIPLEYRIVNERNFFQSSPVERVVSYAVEENQGIVRVKQPAFLLLLFDRSILFPWETAPQYACAADPLEVQIMIPTSHIPYLINLAALEIANGVKAEASLVSQLKDQLRGQEKELMRNNVRDKVKQSYTHRDFAFNFWNRRMHG